MGKHNIFLFSVELPIQSKPEQHIHATRNCKSLCLYNGRYPMVNTSVDETM